MLSFFKQNVKYFFHLTKEVVKVYPRGYADKDSSNTKKQLEEILHYFDLHKEFQPHATKEDSTEEWVVLDSRDCREGMFKTNWLIFVFPFHSELNISNDIFC